MPVVPGPNSGLAQVGSVNVQPDLIDEILQAACDVGLDVAGDRAAWAKEAIVNPPMSLVSHPAIAKAAAALRPTSPHRPSFLKANRLDCKLDGARWVRTADRWRAFGEVKRQLQCGSISAVAGVSRSGLSSAVELSMEWHLPVFSLSKHGLLDLRGGWRSPQSADRGTLLVIDDTVASGQSLRSIRPRIDELRANWEVVIAAIYVAPERVGDVDLYGEVLPLPHLLEWNFANSIHCDHAALDFDGVLCEDCTPEQDDDGPRYMNFLQNARVEMAFRKTRIPLVVTARLEKYRAVTLEWLDRHGMQVDRLVMGQWSSLAERRAEYSAGEYKGGEFALSDCSMFVESCPVQAAEISAAVPDRLVICPTSADVFLGGKS